MNNIFIERFEDINEIGFTIKKTSKELNKRFYHPVNLNSIIPYHKFFIQLDSVNVRRRCGEFIDIVYPLKVNSLLLISKIEEKVLEKFKLLKKYKITKIINTINYRCLVPCSRLKISKDVIIFDEYDKKINNENILESIITNKNYLINIYLDFIIIDIENNKIEYLWLVKQMKENSFSFEDKFIERNFFNDNKNLNNPPPIFNILENKVNKNRQNSSQVLKLGGLVLSNDILSKQKNLLKKTISDDESSNV